MNNRLAEPRRKFTPEAHTSWGWSGEKSDVFASASVEITIRCSKNGLVTQDQVEASVKLWATDKSQRKKAKQQDSAAWDAANLLASQGQQLIMEFLQSAQICPIAAPTSDQQQPIDLDISAVQNALFLDWEEVVRTMTATGATYGSLNNPSC
jgi:hypothetical protein